MNIKHKLNRSLFEKWTNESAYLYGVLEAEGCITQSQIYLQLGKIELEWITNLRDLAGSTTKIREQYQAGFSNKKGELHGYCVAFCSKQWVQNLSKLGFRSGSLPKIPKKYMPYLLRGYFDGDGTICIDADNACYLSSFYGHPITMMEEIRQILDCGFEEARQGPTCSLTKGHKLATIELAKYFPKHEWYMLKRKSDLLDQALVINPLHKQERAKSLNLVSVRKNKRVRYILKEALKPDMEVVENIRWNPKQT